MLHTVPILAPLCRVPLCPTVLPRVCHADFENECWYFLSLSLTNSGIQTPAWQLMPAVQTQHLLTTPAYLVFCQYILCGSVWPSSYLLSFFLGLPSARILGVCCSIQLFPAFGSPRQWISTVSPSRTVCSELQINLGPNPFIKKKKKSLSVRGLSQNMRT